MRLSSLVVVILRLFSLYWFVSFIITLLAALPIAASYLTPGLSTSWMAVSAILIAPIGYLLLAIPTWIFAEKFARYVTGGQDFEFQKSAIEAKHLYTLGLLVVGVYLFLTRLGSSMNWLYFLAVNQAGDDLMHGRDGLSIYDVTREVFPCLGGLYLACCSGKFGRRLAKSDSEVAP